MNKEKLTQLVRETGELRRDLAQGAEIEEGTLTVELTNRDLAAIVYALSSTWISEYVSQVEGYVLILDLLGEASSTILVADAAPRLQEEISSFLKGKENPEEAADGA